MGYVAIPREAVAVTACHDGFDAAVFRLYVHADDMRWRPFPCSDRWMVSKLGIAKRQCRALLHALVAAGCLEIVDPGNENDPRMVRLFRAEDLLVADEADRVPDRVRTDRRTAKRTASNTTKQAEPDRSPDRSPDPVPDRVKHVERTEEIILHPTPQPPVATVGPPASAGGPHWPTVTSKTRKEPSGPYHAAIAAWDREYLATFGVSYPWVFHGRDADGARVKSWLSTARVTQADQTTGIERLRRSFVAYFEAVLSQEAWPRGDPATTKRYSADIAKWMQVDPDNPIRKAPEKQSFASKELQRLWQEADDEERALGITQDHPESDSPPPGLRVLQRTP